MTLKALENKLKRAGFMPDRIKLVNPDREALRLVHDYTGPYPTKEVLNIHSTICSIARKAGFTAENRGHYTATYIF